MYWSMKPELRGFAPSREPWISRKGAGKKRLSQIHALPASFSHMYACSAALAPCLPGPPRTGARPWRRQTNLLFNAENHKA